MVVYVKDLIKASLRVVGVLAKSEAPTDDEYLDALQALNFMLASWSVRSLMVLGTVLENFALVAGTRTYTIGTGATFDTVKPSDIDFAFVRDSDNNDTDLSIYEESVYAAIDDKLIALGRPYVLYFDPGRTQQTVDTGTIYLYPVPDKAYTLYLGEQKPLVEFATVDDLVSIQSAYYEAMKYQLGVRLYREYHEHNRPLPNDIIELARSSMKTLESMNAKQVIAKMDFPEQGRAYDIYTGE